jgi:phage terminase large subunit GpA-like protein
MAAKKKTNGKAKREVPAAAAALVAEVKKTKSAPALTAVVKHAIAQRDYLLGKSVDEPDHTRHLQKLKDAKSRDRVKRLCSGIDKLEDRKAVSVVCRAAIEQRKTVRAAL